MFDNYGENFSFLSGFRHDKRHPGGISKEQERATGE